ncbi:MAG: S9 family peptidase [Deltaproteobacteria bacterium]|nr:S9 family peptidase [Deltaproteobacteria bacterium]
MPAASARLPADSDPDVVRGEPAARVAELARKAEGIVAAFHDRDAELAPDGKRFLFRSNMPGIQQLYVGELAHPEAPPLRIVNTSEAVAGARLERDGKSAVFLSDRGADENYSIFRVDLDGSHLVELTPGDRLHRDLPFLPERAPATMVYSARSAADRSTRILVQPTSPAFKSTVVYTDPSPGALADVDATGSRALFIRFESPSESKLLLVDLKRGTGRVIFPDGKPAVVHDASLSADARSVFIATDDGGETGTLIALDLATLKHKARYVESNPATARITSVSVSRKGGALGLTVDAGNHKELRILDAATLQVRRPVTLALGSGSAGRFSEDGKHLTATWSTADRPPEVFRIDVASGAVQPLRREARPTLASLPAIETSIVQVASFDGQLVPVNLYLPSSAARPPKLPVVVTLHGGPAASSSIQWNAFTRWFSALGYAVVEPNIRGSTGFGRAWEMADNGPRRLDAVKDMEAVGRWAASQPWADARRMVVFGGSYGGYMVLMALTRQSDLWSAGIDLVGPSHWRSFMASTAGYIASFLSKEFGSVDKDGPFLDSTSPLADAHKIVDPLFVYQGQNDPRVPRSESDQIVRSLRARGVPVEYMVAANEGHSVDRVENMIELMARAARFLERSLPR